VKQRNFSSNLPFTLKKKVLSSSMQIGKCLETIIVDPIKVCLIILYIKYIKLVL